jgi:peptidoglycan/xylan/chitin deacetylase (PgdA/CDA1 family)
MGVKSAIRRGASRVVGGLGLDRPLAKLKGGRAMILAYHRVLDPATCDLDGVEPGMYVTKDAFADHLRLLEDRYTVVPLAHIVQRHLTGEELEPGTVAITFDDAWLDTYEVAYPLLRRFGMPATVFVPTGLIDADHHFWFSRAAVLIGKIYQRREKLRANFPDDEMPVAGGFIMDVLVANPSRSGYFARIMESLKQLGDFQRDTVIDFLETLVGQAVELPRELCSWDELREMAAANFEIGSHTAGHAIMTQLTVEQVRRELETSKETIIERIGRPPASFCYPNGNYNETIKRQVQRAGYVCAVTTQSGFADPPTDLFELPRPGVHQGVAPDGDGLAFLLTGMGG